MAKKKVVELLAEVFYASGEQGKFGEVVDVTEEVARVLIERKQARVVQ